MTSRGDLVAKRIELKEEIHKIAANITIIADFNQNTSAYIARR